MTKVQPDVQQSSLCVYNQLENGIHRFTFTKASRLTVDAFVDQMNTVFAIHASDEKVLCLMDWRQSGIPPLRRLAGRGKEFLHSHSEGPDVCIAFLTNTVAMVNIAQTLLDVINPKAQKRFFQDDQYDEAVAWLLKH